MWSFENCNSTRFRGFAWYCVRCVQSVTCQKTFISSSSCNDFVLFWVVLNLSQRNSIWNLSAIASTSNSNSKVDELTFLPLRIIKPSNMLLRTSYFSSVKHTWATPISIYCGLVIGCTCYIVCAFLRNSILSTPETWLHGNEKMIYVYTCIYNIC